MANELLQSELEKIKDKHPRLYNEYKCFGWIAETYRKEIADIYHKCDENQIPYIMVFPYYDDQESTKIQLARLAIDDARDLYANTVYQGLSEALTAFNHRLKLPGVPVLCVWVWTSEGIEAHGSRFDRQPLCHIGTIPAPFRWNAFQEQEQIRTKAPKKPSVPEKTLEESLLEWLHAYGVKADNQISVGRHRMDLWIPGQCFLELKKSKVSGDDVCQAIDYCAERQKPVILVGNHISEMASRGIEAFNKAVNSEMIIFVSWSGIRTYLKGLLGLS